MANLSNLNNKFLVTTGGNVLIGKTGANNATVGTQIMSTGDINPTVSGDTVARFNRLSNDGEIIRFQQDTLTDGAINSLSGRIAIGSGTTGIFFDSIRDVVTPHNMTTNAYSANISLGRNLIRFKDIYLSGQVNAGGAITAASDSFKCELDGSGNILLDLKSTGSQQIRFFDTNSSYTEAMRILRFDDKLSITYGDNANEEALTVVGAGSTAGFVGIGTTNPQVRLDISGDVEIPYGNKYFMDTVGAARSNFLKTINSYETVVGTNRGSAGFAVVGNSNIRLGFGTDYTTAQTSLFINSSGNVGIGVTPNVSYSKLQVKSPASSYGFDLIGRDAGSNGESQITFWNSNQTTQLAAIFNIADNLYFTTGTSERMRITSGGDITVSGGDIFLNSGTNYNDKGVVYLSNERTAIISDIVNATANGDTSLDFQTRKGGTRASAMFIDEFRNVGIGTTSPSGVLHVKSSAATTTGMVRLQNDMDNNYETLRVESLGNYDAHIGFHTAGSSAYWWGVGIDYSDSGKFKISGDNILSVNPRLTIDTSGNVGINTTAPTAKLDIAGDVRYQGSIYSEYTYNGSGNYSSGTIYTIASTGQLTINGMYQLVMYLDDFGAGGGTYFSWFCSVPFYWVTTGTNRTVSQNLPPLIGTGHAIGTIPTFTITQELGTAGGQAKIRFNPQNNWTGINGTSGKQFTVYIKRLGG